MHLLTLVRLMAGVEVGSGVQGAPFSVGGGDDTRDQPCVLMLVETV